MPQQPTKSPDLSSMIANATPPDGVSVVANARQFDANWSMTASASMTESGGVGCPRRSRTPLYRRIAGSAKASAMNPASPLDQGRRVITSSESVTTGSSASGSGSSSGDALGPSGSTRQERDLISGASRLGSNGTVSSCPPCGRLAHRRATSQRSPRCAVMTPGRVGRVPDARAATLIGRSPAIWTSHWALYSPGGAVLRGRHQHG